MNLAGMGLSPDPEKRRRQLSNLERGYPALARKHGLDAPGRAEPTGTATVHRGADDPPSDPGALPVLPYAKPTTAKPARKPRARSKPAEPDQPVEHVDEPQRGGGGFWAGFLGG